MWTLRQRSVLAIVTHVLNTLPRTPRPMGMQQALTFLSHVKMRLLTNSSNCSSMLPNTLTGMDGSLRTNFSSRSRMHGWQKMPRNTIEPCLADVFHRGIYVTG